MIDLIDLRDGEIPGVSATHVVRWEVSSHLAVAEVWPAACCSDGTILALEDGGSGGPVHPDEAKEPIARIRFKWDGCADIDLSPCGCMYHVCGVDGVRDLGRLLERLHLQARDLIPAAKQ